MIVLKTITVHFVKVNFAKMGQALYSNTEAGQPHEKKKQKRKKKTRDSINTLITTWPFK